MAAAAGWMALKAEGATTGAELLAAAAAMAEAEVEAVGAAGDDLSMELSPPKSKLEAALVSSGVWGGVRRPLPLSFVAARKEEIIRHKSPGSWRQQPVRAYLGVVAAPLPPLPSVLDVGWRQRAMSGAKGPWAYWVSTGRGR